MKTISNFFTIAHKNFWTWSQFSKQSVSSPNVATFPALSVRDPDINLYSVSSAFTPRPIPFLQLSHLEHHRHPFHTACSGQLRGLCILQFQTKLHYNLHLPITHPFVVAVNTQVHNSDTLFTGCL